MKKGLLIVNTGEGKGKTTAALGMAMRAAGHGQRVCFIQFIKGTWKYGEMEAVDRFKDLIDFHVMGNGFTWNSKDPKQTAETARRAWYNAQTAIESGCYDMVVLDELTYLLQYRMVDPAQCINALTSRDKNLHVVVTGRYAPQELLETADMVTEMKTVKHPFEKGVKAQKGIEF